MVRKYRLRVTVLFQTLTGVMLILSLSQCSSAPTPETAAAQQKEISVVTRTNGIIEPLHTTNIYASVDGSIQSIACKEGSEVSKGQILFQLNAPQTQISLAEARAALLETKRQARVVLEGPPKEELDSLEASVEETELQLQQVTDELSAERSLFDKGAVSMESVERLRKQQDLFQMQVEGLRQKKENLLARYSEEDKQLMRDKIATLSNQVALLEKQAENTSIPSPTDGLVYALPVQPGSYVARGQMMAQIYQPGQVRLRAYVDEPDLGRIQPGQPVMIEWDGMAGTRWEGAVVQPAERTLSLNNRSIGYVLCSVNGNPKELIPNINVKVEIVTDRKANALVVPRSAVFSREGKSAVLVPDGTNTSTRFVVIGLVTYNEVEILQGLEPGDTVITNPGKMLAEK